MAKPQKERLPQTREIAKQLGVTTVTVRKYTNEFSGFLSPAANNTTSRHFTPEDVKTLQLASSLLRQGYTYEEVRKVMEDEKVLEGEVFMGDVEPPEPPQQDSPPSAIQPLEFFQTFVDTLNKEHKSHIDTLKEENARLREEIEYLRLPWFRRWFARRK